MGDYLVKTKEIIAFANELKTKLGKDPFKIAEYFGIKVSFWDSNMKDFTAQTFKADGYPTIISIGNRYSDTGKMVLCAHELGHALLHEGINNFKVTKENMKSNVEYEANLFAVALLFEQRELSMQIDKMPNSTLKILLDYNICNHS